VIIMIIMIIIMYLCNYLPTTYNYSRASPRTMQFLELFISGSSPLRTDVHLPTYVLLYVLLYVQYHEHVGGILYPCAAAYTGHPRGQVHRYIGTL